MIFRFAPSPNGRLHLGHAYSALLNFDAAQRTGGRFLLRLEDTDVTRARPAYRDGILTDLAWLGLTWEAPVRVQSAHLDVYHEALVQLAKMDLLYEARLSRAEIARHVTAAERTGERLAWPHDPDGAPHYPNSERAQLIDPKDLKPWSGACLPKAGTGFWKKTRTAQRNAAASRINENAASCGPRDYAIRLNLARALEIAGKRQPTVALDWREITAHKTDHIQRVVAAPHLWGDVMLVGRDRPVTYHLAVVVDDALQGVTHVVRGKDLEPATSLHRLLQVLLDLPAPLYCHHDLIQDADGRKLSKSAQDQSLASLRAAGATAADIRQSVNFDGPATQTLLQAIARTLPV